MTRTADDSSALRSLADALDDEIRAERAESLSGPDSAAGRDLARAIGENVVRLSALRGLDVAALAAAADLPVGQVQLVEQGGGLPGLRMIWRLASALKVPFGALLERTMLSGMSDPDFHVQRVDRGFVVSTPGGLRSRALSIGGPVQAPEVYDLTLAPHAEESADAHAQDTFEHIVVTAGTLRIDVGSKSVELHAGDSIFFRANAPHRYHNPGSTESRAVLIMLYGS